MAQGSVTDEEGEEGALRKKDAVDCEDGGFLDGLEAREGM